MSSVFGLLTAQQNGTEDNKLFVDTFRWEAIGRYKDLYKDEMFLKTYCSWKSEQGKSRTGVEPRLPYIVVRIVLGKTQTKWQNKQMEIWTSKKNCSTSLEEKLREAEDELETQEEELRTSNDSIKSAQAQSRRVLKMLLQQFQGK